MNSTPKPSAKLHSFYTGLAENLAYIREKVSPKIREAHNPNNGYFRLREVGGSGDAAGQLFNRISNRPIAHGDRVLVEYLADGEAVIAGRLHVPGEDDTLVLQADGDTRYIRRALPPFSPTGHIITGRYVSLLNHYPIGTLTGITLTADRVYYVPVWVPKDVTIDAVLFNVTTVVSGNVRVGIYEMNSDFLPTSRIQQSSTVLYGALGVKTHALAGTVNLTGGRWYFLALVSSSAMGISGVAAAGALPSLRGGAAGTFGDGFVIMAIEDIGAGWSALPAVATPSSGGTNQYVHLAARTI